MAFYAVANFREFFLGVLQEVGCGAVGLQRGVVLVLLIDEEAARFGLVPVHRYMTQPGSLRDSSVSLEKTPAISALAANFRHPCHRQDNHHCSVRLDCC